MLLQATGLWQNYFEAFGEIKAAGMEYRTQFYCMVESAALLVAVEPKIVLISATGFIAGEEDDVRFWPRKKRARKATNLGQAAAPDGSQGAMLAPHCLPAARGEGPASGSGSRADEDHANEKEGEAEKEGEEFAGLADDGDGALDEDLLEALWDAFESSLDAVGEEKFDDEGDEGPPKADIAAPFDEDDMAPPAAGAEAQVVAEPPAGLVAAPPQPEQEPPPPPLAPPAAPQGQQVLQPLGDGGDDDRVRRKRKRHLRSDKNSHPQATSSRFELL